MDMVLFVSRKCLQGKKKKFLTYATNAHQYLFFLFTLYTAHCGVAFAIECLDTGYEILPNIKISMMSDTKCAI